MADTVPVHIDYRKKLGEGAVGEVYEGTWKGVPCAVKILSGYRASRQSKQECKVASKLKHPNIVPYYCVYHPEEKKTIFVMEKMDLNLTQFLEKEKSCNTIDFQIHASVQISSALCYLHGRGIIHRDLSSSNILLRFTCSSTLDVKVAGFGVSKILHGNCENQSTLTGIPGTDKYMPPEAFYDKPAYSASFDIFSLGVLLIQMMTGLRPDPSERVRATDTPSEQMFHRTLLEVKECFRRKSHIDQIPPKHPLRALALECIEDDQTKRPTAEDICVQLESIRAQQQQAKMSSLKQEFAKQHQKFKDEITALKAEKEQMEEHIRDLTTQNEEMEDLKIKNEEMEERIVYLTTQNEQMKKLITDLTTQNEQRKKHITVLMAESEQRKKHIMEWKQNTLESINSSFNQLK